MVSAALMRGNPKLHYFHSGKTLAAQISSEAVQEQSLDVCVVLQVTHTEPALHATLELIRALRGADRVAVVQAEHCATLLRPLVLAGDSGTQLQVVQVTDYDSRSALNAAQDELTTHARADAVSAIVLVCDCTPEDEAFTVLKEETILCILGVRDMDSQRLVTTALRHGGFFSFLEDSRMLLQSLLWTCRSLRLCVLRSISIEAHDDASSWSPFAPLSGTSLFGEASHTCFWTWPPERGAGRVEVRGVGTGKAHICVLGDWLSPSSSPVNTMEAHLLAVLGLQAILRASTREELQGIISRCAVRSVMIQSEQPQLQEMCDRTLGRMHELSNLLRYDDFGMHRARHAACAWLTGLEAEASVRAHAGTPQE
jgi:hypothetical protein